MKKLFDTILTLLVVITSIFQIYFFYNDNVEVNNALLVGLPLIFIIIYMIMKNYDLQLYKFKIKYYESLILNGRLHSVKLLILHTYLFGKELGKNYNMKLMNEILRADLDIDLDIYKTDDAKDLLDVKYNYCFHIKKTKKNPKVDFLILHDIGKTLETVEFRINEKIIYKKAEPLIYKAIRNNKNQDIEKVEFPNITDQEVSMSYTIKEKYNVDLDEVFVFYPINYSRKIGRLNLSINFKNKMKYDISLKCSKTKSLEEVIIGTFTSENDGKTYFYSFEKPKINYLYFVVIKNIKD